MDNNSNVWYRSTWFFWLMVVLMPPVAIILLFVFNHYEGRGIRKGVLAYTIAITAIAVIVGVFSEDTPDRVEPYTAIAVAPNEDATVEQPPEITEPEATPEPLPVMAFDTLLGNSPIINDPLNNERAYLTLLSLVGESFANLALSEENYLIMETNRAAGGDLYEVVTEILVYRATYNNIPAELQQSFGLFWTDDSAAEHPEVYQSLLQSFEINRVLVPSLRWVLEWHGDPISIGLEGFVIATRENMFSGVSLYISRNSEPPHEADGEPIVITAWGNIGSIMEDYVFIEGQGHWTHYTIFTEPLEGFGDYVIRTDDPALIRAEKIFMATEADDFRRITFMEDLGTFGFAARGDAPLPIYMFNAMAGTATFAGYITEPRSAASVMFMDAFGNISQVGVPTIEENYVTRR